MTIYIIERDNPDTRPEPEIMLNGNEAVKIVRKEYEEVIADKFGIDSSSVETENGNYEYYWRIEGDEGTALVEHNWNDRWEWRITKHEI